MPFVLSGCYIFSWIAFSASAFGARGFSPAFISTGWSHINGVLQTQVTAQKPDAAIFWLVHGHDDFPASFDVEAWTICQTTPGLELVADLPAQIAAFVEFFETTGIKRLWFYIGFIGGVPARWAGLTDAQKAAKVIANLAPMYAIRDALVARGHPPDCVGFIGDTLNSPTEGFEGDNWRILIPYIESMGSPDGGEPWPHKTHPRLTQSTWLNTVDERQIAIMDPDIGTATWSAHFRDVQGDWCPYIIGDEALSAQERAVAAAKRFRAVAIEPHADVDTDAIRAACTVTLNSVRTTVVHRQNRTARVMRDPGYTPRRHRTFRPQ